MLRPSCLVPRVVATCDPDQDSGIGWDGCETEHEAVHDCGKDPF